MKFFTNMDIIRTIFLSFLFIVFAVGFSSPVFAEENATSTDLQTVSFTVTVGAMKCSGGKGTAMVQFSNTPEDGGSYEVYGKLITENGIMLSRNVELPTGSYTWKGVPNAGYSPVGITEGEFDVPACNQVKDPEVSEAVESITPLVITQSDSLEQKKKSEENHVFDNPASTTDTATFSEIWMDKFSIQIIIMLVIAGLVFGIFGFLAKGQQ